MKFQMTDYSGLVERLLDMDRVHVGIRKEAAAAIEAQRERIERLEGALQAVKRHSADGASVVASVCYKLARAALEAKS